jgi:hypothetical protein
LHVSNTTISTGTQEHTKTPLYVQIYSTFAIAQLLYCYVNYLVQIPFQFKIVLVLWHACELLAICMHVLAYVQENSILVLIVDVIAIDIFENPLRKYASTALVFSLKQIG